MLNNQDCLLATLDKQRLENPRLPGVESRLQNVNPIPPGLFEGGAAWGGNRKCPRPITLKL